ncbi:MAG: hypothetical protein ACFFEF_16375 [Candidatus Thorarchaeota archaeon]
MPKRARCPYCDRSFDRRELDNHIAKCRSSRHVRKVIHPAVRKSVIVDGNNIAYHLLHNGTPRAENIANAYRSLVSVGFSPTIVISAALKHNIDKPELLATIPDIQEAPRGSNDDLLIIQEAQKRNADIISNDRFLNWLGNYPWLSSRLRRYRLTPSGLILS